MASEKTEKEWILKDIMYAGEAAKGFRSWDFNSKNTNM